MSWMYKQLEVYGQRQSGQPVSLMVLRSEADGPGRRMRRGGERRDIAVGTVKTMQVGRARRESSSGLNAEGGEA